MMMSEASRRPPQHFLVLNEKGGEIAIKARRPSSFVFSSVLFGKTGLSSFANRTVRFCPAKFLFIFSLSCNSGLKDMLYCVNFGVKAGNIFVNLNYTCSCVLVISYPFQVLFMQLCMCECLEIIGVCFLVNMLSLEKLDVPILETGCSGFCGSADKTG
jgi:hypothetical protein